MSARISCCWRFDLHDRTPNTHTWSPLFAKHSIDDGKKVEIAAIHPDFGAAMPLSLMEYAGRILIRLTSFQLSEYCRFDLPRSDLSCHHVMIA